MIALIAIATLLGGAQLPQDKCLVGEGVKLLTIINIISEWTMGNSEAVCPVHLMHKKCRGFPAQGLHRGLFCTSCDTTTVGKGRSGR
jgi:hypothetical protein